VFTLSQRFRKRQRGFEPIQALKEIEKYVKEIKGREWPGQGTLKGEVSLYHWPPV